MATEDNRLLGVRQHIGDGLLDGTVDILESRLAGELLGGLLLRLVYHPIRWISFFNAQKIR